MVLNGDIVPTTYKLATCEKGSGHDQFMTGIIVQFDLTFTVKAWTEAERYHFLDFISSQSTMHRIAKFDLDNQYSEYTDKRMIAIMNELKDKYNAWRHNCDDGAFMVECDIENVTAQVVGLKLFNDNGDWVDVCFDFAENVLKVDRTNSGVLDFNPKFASVSEAPLSDVARQSIKLIVDRSSVECFTDIAAISNLVFPNGCYTRLSFYTIGGTAKVNNLTIKKL